ncbi:hypothetical protein GCM10010166_22210 [Couchioplanes caeruleus subsp. azureus]|nr:hypothetical protein GCM10010166_22210 [Couchioplanes caeruleus subsp. azureus]
MRAFVASEDPAQESLEQLGGRRGRKVVHRLFEGVPHDGGRTKSISVSRHAPPLGAWEAMVAGAKAGEFDR